LKLFILIHPFANGKCDCHGLKQSDHPEPAPTCTWNRKSSALNGPALIAWTVLPNY